MVSFTQSEKDFLNKVLSESKDKQAKEILNKINNEKKLKYVHNKKEIKALLRQAFKEQRYEGLSRL